jgi:hypothetical protein
MKEPGFKERFVDSDGELTGGTRCRCLRAPATKSHRTPDGSELYTSPRVPRFDGGRGGGC